MVKEKKTIEQLEKELEEALALNSQLIEEKQQDMNLNYAWTGNLGHWYWHVPSNKVTFNPLKITVLGYDENELPKEVTYQYFTDKLHPDDYEKAMQIMRNHLQGKLSVYEVEYRIKAKDGSYRWYYDRGKITKYDKNNKPELIAGIVFDITEKKMLEEKLEQQNKQLYELSLTDGLTKVRNHRALIQILEEEIRKSDESDKPLSIALFDLDFFKKVNDTKGHLCGDEVLVDLGRIMMQNVRSSDTVGRYGGEEFMMIFPGTSLDYAKEICEKIRLAVEEFKFSCDLKVTISAGVCEYDKTGISDAIRRVDTLLYKAKNNGRNRIEA
ncbi:MAG: sensor domain-containing diguanylate cyclase [Clostridia bacterium]|nr:sensor domain-containing diguanylate cyclase [Clostridia bacterium]